LTVVLLPEVCTKFGTGEDRYAAWLMLDCCMLHERLSNRRRPLNHEINIWSKPKESKAHIVRCGSRAWRAREVEDLRRKRASKKREEREDRGWAARHVSPKPTSTYKSAILAEYYYFIQQYDAHPWYRMASCIF
jgi:hypothetical protein